MSSIKAICYCKEEKEIYFPCEDIALMREQLEWLFRHLRDHKAVYFESPFDLNITTMKVDWTIGLEELGTNPEEDSGEE